MLAELPLSTWTHRALKLAINKLLTKTSSWEWWNCEALSSGKLMVGLLILASFGRRLVICTLCTIRKQVFLSFLEEPIMVLPLMITCIFLRGALGRSSTCRLSFGSFGRLLSLSLPKKSLQFPLLNEDFYLLFQIIAFISAMPMVPMEVAILVPWPLIWVTLQFVWP